MGGPLLLLFAAAVQSGGLRATSFFHDFSPLSGVKKNLEQLLDLNRLGEANPSPWDMFANSVAIAGGVAISVVSVGFLAAYAMTFLLRRGGRFWFSLTLLTLYFPVEARMLQTFDVAVHLGLINSLTGLILPVLPLALATFIFCQHMKTLPPQLLEAARLDGAGPIRFLFNIVVPLSLVPIGAVFIISFLIGWNQYLWPLMISIDNTYFPLMRGINLVGAGSGASMLLAAISITPALLLVIGFNRLLSRVTSVHL
ncbi:carbohydrate ABC transporter permease [Pseudopelagicola sp. nBUS_19]|uniref:carbohydrate ABC transporter permease n=1 Tax=Pseudopelagicola sp. nBUS_19 TaxID=3395316 RepID=UPI003EB7A20F